MSKMSGKDTHLYGASRPKKGGKEINSSTTLTFASQLSSLLSSSSSNNSRAAANGRSRASGKKEDIFATHNKNAKARAAKDLENTDNPAFAQAHSTTSDALDSAQWHRSRRKMEEKARLYAAMKRGDVEDADERYAVDFDRKWADKQAAGEADEDLDSSSDESAEDTADKELVEWVDEFGRTRTSTKREMQRAQRAAELAEEIATRARPAAPEKLIFGDTVQVAAFNPDELTAQQMAELAAKRDKEATPPPDTHFDSSKEVRSKGVGFMQFSLDEEERKQQMRNLETERTETEKARKEREERARARKEEVERRRMEIAARRGKRKADDFLDGLGAELSAKQQKTEEDGAEKADAPADESKEDTAAPLVATETESEE